ncbi:MAG: hypothetical protein ACYTFY_00555 [Planctomycetota bacterium]|jgi:hypothetical protein
MQSGELFHKFIKAQKATKIVRARKNLLFTFGATKLPYAFLAESAVNEGDIVLRKGTVTVEPPKIIAPSEEVQIEGFDFEESENGMVPVVLNRWVHFPAAKYQNSNTSLDVVTGPIEIAVEEVINKLDQKNDIRTGVISGFENTWGFSILSYVGQMIVKSAPSNIGEYYERFGLDSPGY